MLGTTLLLRRDTGFSVCVDARPQSVCAAVTPLVPRWEAHPPFQGAPQTLPQSQCARTTACYACHAPVGVTQPQLKRHAALLLSQRNPQRVAVPLPHLSPGVGRVLCGAGALRRVTLAAAAVAGVHLFLTLPACCRGSGGIAQGVHLSSGEGAKAGGKEIVERRPTQDGAQPRDRSSALQREETKGGRLILLWFFKWVCTSWQFGGGPSHQALPCKYVGHTTYLDSFIW